MCLESLNNFEKNNCNNLFLLITIIFLSTSTGVDQTAKKLCYQLPSQREKWWIRQTGNLLIIPIMADLGLAIFASASVLLLNIYFFFVKICSFLFMIEYFCTSFLKFMYTHAFFLFYRTFRLLLKHKYYVKINQKRQFKSIKH